MDSKWIFVGLIGLLSVGACDGKDDGQEESRGDTVGTAETDSGDDSGDTAMTTTAQESEGGSDRGLDTDDDGEPVCDPVADFTCTGWCESLPDESACYTRCTPDSADVIGQADDECTDPARPYCAQIGDSLGGDWLCNACAHVCVGTPGINDCAVGVNDCSA